MDNSDAYWVGEELLGGVKIQDFPSGHVKCGKPKR
jgi:hypothetical protein